uniref:DEP domain containing 1 n=1 Tax=Oncorhynchus kisutch TaxID=8019 RepID=A0A8C7N5X6_ONCKI
AVDWLHELLRNNRNFGPDVTRQQTVQLLKKFLKNHVIEDVKGRWGSEDFEDNWNCPLAPGPASVKKSFSMREKEGFKCRSSKKLDKDTVVSIVDVINVPLLCLQRTLGLTSLEDVLDPRHINPQNIVYNMTIVNKHGVVTLEDKTDDLPHWVLSAMKGLANWPKYDASQPSYPGFERDEFKTVSDYFYSLPRPILTSEYYKLFVNILGKRKNQEVPSYPQPAKKHHMNSAVNQFKSTESLLLSLIRKGAFDEGDSPMREVLFRESGVLQNQTAALTLNPKALSPWELLLVWITPHSVRCPRSIGTCLDIAKHRKMSASCFGVNVHVANITMKPDSSIIGLRGPSLLNLRASSMDLRPEPSVSRRCQLSGPQVAIEALQLCTLFLPPASRRKLQLLMRMISRMSQNMDLPRLHDAIMAHMFSHCVLGCKEEMDLDELLATRLVSFLMDHHQEILQGPVYLQNAVQDHIAYLRKVQVQYYCCFYFYKLSLSQAAIADLLESLVKDKNMSMEDRKKKLKQSKPPLLISMKRPQAFSIRN